MPTSFATGTLSLFRGTTAPAIHVRVSGQVPRRNSTHYLALVESFSPTGGYAPRIVPRSFNVRSVSIVTRPVPHPRHFRRLTTPSSAWEVSTTQSSSEPQARHQTPASVRKGSAVNGHSRRIRPLERRESGLKAPRQGHSREYFGQPRNGRVSV